MGWRDDWPSMPDGGDYDGKRLLTLSRTGRSPFQELWDVNLLIEEIEEYTGTQVIDIPVVNKGSNNYVRVHSISQSVAADLVFNPGLPCENVE